MALIVSSLDKCKHDRNETPSPKAKMFYEGFSFTEVSTNTMTLYLPMATAIQAL